MKILVAPNSMKGSINAFDFADVVENAFLQRFATSLHILGKASREITGHIPGVIEQSLKDHEAIVTAIEARDGTATAEAMKTHLLNVRKAYRGQGE